MHVVNAGTAPGVGAAPALREPAEGYGIAVAECASGPPSASRKTVGRGLGVDEQRVVEIGGGEFVLLGPVILSVLPFGLVPALGQ